MDPKKNLKFWTSRNNASGGNSPAFFANDPGRHEDIQAFLKELGINISHNTSVLDVGCNCGRLLEGFRLAGSKPKYLHGLEPNPAAHEERRKTFGELDDANIHQGDSSLLETIFPKRKFTIGVASAVLVHLTDKERQGVLEFFNERCKYILLTVNPGGKKRQDTVQGREGRIWNPDRDEDLEALGCTLVGERPWKPHPTWTIQLWRTTRK